MQTRDNTRHPRKREKVFISQQRTLTNKNYVFSKKNAKAFFGNNKQNQPNGATLCIVSEGGYA